MNKQVAILGAGMGSLGARALMAAVIAGGNQVVVDHQPLRHKEHPSSNPFEPKRKKKKTSRIRKQWYTVDSPEVKRMSKG